jgi:hypothetical protein
VPSVKQHRRALAGRCRLFDGGNVAEVKELFILFFLRLFLFRLFIFLSLSLFRLSFVSDFVLSVFQSVNQITQFAAPSLMCSSSDGKKGQEPAPSMGSASSLTLR